MSARICAVCAAPIGRYRRVYCSDECSLAGHAVRFRERYYSDPSFARRKNAYAREWSKSHPEQRRMTRVAYRARLKAAAFAAVLQRAAPPLRP